MKFRFEELLNANWSERLDLNKTYNPNSNVLQNVSLKFWSQLCVQKVMTIIKKHKRHGEAHAENKKHRIEKSQCLKTITTNFLLKQMVEEHANNQWLAAQTLVYNSKTLVIIIFTHMNRL